MQQLDRGTTRGGLLIEGPGFLRFVEVAGAMTQQAQHEETILTRDDVACWLKVRPRQVERLGVPCLDLGRKTKRYLWSDVLAWLEAQRASAHGAP